MPLLMFLPYDGKKEEGGGEGRRVRCPRISSQRTVTTTGKMGEITRGKNLHPLGNGRNNNDGNDNNNRLQRIGVMSSIHWRLVDDAGIIVGGILVYSRLGTPPPPQRTAMATAMATNACPLPSILASMIKNESKNVNRKTIIYYIYDISIVYIYYYLHPHPIPSVPQLTFLSFVPNKQNAFVHSFIVNIIVQSSHPSSFIPPTFI